MLDRQVVEPDDQGRKAGRRTLEWSVDKRLWVAPCKLLGGSSPVSRYKDQVESISQLFDNSLLVARNKDGSGPV